MPKKKNDSATEANSKSIRVKRGRPRKYAPKEYFTLGEQKAILHFLHDTLQRIRKSYLSEQIASMMDERPSDDARIRYYKSAESCIRWMSTLARQARPRKAISDTN